MACPIKYRRYSQCSIDKARSSGSIQRLATEQEPYFVPTGKEFVRYRILLVAPRRIRWSRQLQRRQRKLASGNPPNIPIGQESGNHKEDKESQDIEKHGITSKARSTYYS